MILFFRGSGPVAALIRWQTRGAYAHCGWLARDGRFYEAHGHGGVQVHASPWVLNSGPADAYSVRGLTAGQASRIEAFLAATVGHRYDWWGVVRFLSGVNRDNDTRWFCSELVAEACTSAGRRLQNTDPWRLSPSTLAWSPDLLLAAGNIHLPWWRARFHPSTP